MRWVQDLGAREIEKVMGGSLTPDVKEISSEDGRCMNLGPRSCSLSVLFINGDERSGHDIIALPI